MSKPCRLTIFMLAALAASAVAEAAGGAHTGTLRIEINGLKSSQPVYFGLWSSEKGFLASKPFKGAKQGVASGKASWTVSDLPYGTYGASAWQDLNGNGKLDANEWGAPVEPTGVSNNAQGHFGPPAYKDAAFRFRQPELRITFKLACPMGCLPAK